MGLARGEDRTAPSEMAANTDLIDSMDIERLAELTLKNAEG